jgi:hypothetical protein
LAVVGSLHQVYALVKADGSVKRSGPSIGEVRGLMPPDKTWIEGEFVPEPFLLIPQEEIYASALTKERTEI